VPIEPTEVQVDILGPGVESAARQILADRFRRRVDLGLKKRADAARSTLPPQKARYLDIPFSGRSRKPDERSSSNACGIHCPVGPSAHIVGSDYKMIDPMNCAFRFDV
jgi:hypothetical protein